MVIVKLLWKKPTGLARFFHIIFWHFTVSIIKPTTEKPRSFFKKQENSWGFFFLAFNSFSLGCQENQVFLKTGLRFSNSPLCYHPEFDSLSCLDCNLNRDPGKYYDIKLSITDKKFSNSLSKKPNPTKKQTTCFSSV